MASVTHNMHHNKSRLLPLSSCIYHSREYSPSTEQTYTYRYSIPAPPQTYITVENTPPQQNKHTHTDIAYLLPLNHSTPDGVTCVTALSRTEHASLLLLPLFSHNFDKHNASCIDKQK